jgi:energy-coupling factor transporter ATP-binding protein EcfA2
LEGIDPDSCPHHFYLTEDNLNEHELEENTEKISYQRLFTGLALTISETRAITERAECERVFIIGESGSGKTSLLATIFDLFQMGPIDDNWFAGSYTQPGFEERCHRARVVSQADVPHAEKTISKDFNFLHLAVKRKNLITRPAINFLLSDISGERLQQARDSSSAMTDLNIIKSTSNIVYIIDGEKLSQIAEKHVVLFNAKSFIQRALDEQIFNNETELTIIVSKWDILLNSPFDFDKEIVGSINMQFKLRLKKLNFLKLAARPISADAGLKFGFGVKELLNHWIESALEEAKSNFSYEDIKLESDRLIDKLNSTYDK